MGAIENNQDSVKANAKNIDVNQQVKKKQYTVFMIVITVIVLAGLYVTLQKKNERAQQNSQEEAVQQLSEKAVNKNFAEVGRQIDKENIWLETGIRQLEALKKNQKVLEDRLEASEVETKKSDDELDKRLTDAQKNEVYQLKQELEKLQKQMEAMKHSNPNRIVNDIVSTNPRASNQAIEPTPENVRKPININNRFFSPEDIKRSAQIPEAYRNQNGVTPNMSTAPMTPSVDYSEMRSISLVDEPVSEITSDETTSQMPSASQTEPVKRIKTADNFTPAGSSFRVVMLGGLDAPTGGNAQDDPHPVVLLVDDLAQLPNRYESDFRECRITGSGYGSISAERAYIRTEKISCIDADGVVYQKKMKALLFGEDGRPGFKGNVISKQGQVLANALLAGIGSGIGRAFQQQATTVSTNSLGTVTTIDPDKVWMAGAGAGVGTALDALAKYYIDLAEQLFPVIEVGAGRVGDIVLIDGLDWLEDEDGTDVVSVTQNNATAAVNRALEFTNQRIEK